MANFNNTIYLPQVPSAWQTWVTSGHVPWSLPVPDPAVWSLLLHPKLDHIKIIKTHVAMRYAILRLIIVIIYTYHKFHLHGKLEWHRDMYPGHCPFQIRQFDHYYCTLNHIILAYSDITNAWKLPNIRKLKMQYLMVIITIIYTYHKCRLRGKLEWLRDMYPGHYLFQIRPFDHYYCTLNYITYDY